VIKTQELQSTKTIAKPPFSQELAQELLATYGSPLYVYQDANLRQTIAQITQAIPYPRTQFHFASVTNGSVALLQIFQRAGWGLHANTPGDIYLGLKAGFAPSKIVYSGSNLSRAEMDQLLRWGVTTLNLDSLAQLQLFCEVYSGTYSSLLSSTPRLGLRLNLPEITGDSRIGVRPAEFTEASVIASSAHLKLSGLHFYRGTGTNATQAFTQVIDTVIATAQQLPDWQYLDFGGGFGYPYQADGVAFDWGIFGTELTNTLYSIGNEIDLIIEPGRAAIAGCGTLLAQVVSVKWQDDKQLVGVDTSIANLAVLSVHGGYRKIISWKENEETRESQNSTQSQIQPPLPSQGIQNPKSKIQNFLHPTDVCGNTTYSRDYLGKNCQLPALQMGDIIAILDVGAYGYAMSSHFLHRPRPAEVLLEENGQHRLIRASEDYSILLNNQVFN
jgi:diaminopimelate decarboxylase